MFFVKSLYLQLGFEALFIAIMTKKIILISGVKGQLGRLLEEVSRNFGQFDFVFTDVDELDITDYQQLHFFFLNNRIDFMINCAAYTAVDKAEEERDEAYRINAEACGYLAEFGHKFDFKLVHISTDFVFSGQQNRPCKEDDATEPLSVYGDSKLKGEQLIQQNGTDFIIIRTSWLYSEYGRNFVRNMQKLGMERSEISVVYDQCGSPTYAGDLAWTILYILANYPSAKGIYHFANEGAVSWFDFAQAVMELSNINCKVKAILTTEYPTPAKRPLYSVMDKGKIKNAFTLEIPYWRESLRKCIEKMK